MLDENEPLELLSDDELESSFMSESNDEPNSINIDISNGSPLNDLDFKLYPIWSLTVFPDMTSVGPKQTKQATAQAFPAIHHSDDHKSILISTAVSIRCG